ncbi:MAG: hypothetical protein K2P65_15295 [Lachnospiraceae bacterium]|nr:hypothetical protein [Lachnospiraceae bacterium]
MAVSRQTVAKWEAGDAVITIRQPFENAFERIPNAYKKIMQYLGAKGFK